MSALIRPTALLLCSTLGSLACGDRKPVLTGELGPDRPHLLRDGSPASGDGVWFADLTTIDRARPSSDAGPCGVVCQPDEVHLISPCVRTDQLFSCAASCDPKVSASCPAGQTCSAWGGTPCCYCAAAVPACVPKASTGKITGPLRIAPTSGAAGQKVTLTIQGAPFYVGALFYGVRMGNQQAEWDGDAPSSECTMSVSFTPSPGVYPVEVSQYGGGGPWVLAGFFVASGGVIPMPTIQPGFACASNPAPGDPACASAPPYSCKCVSGRCLCQ